jgi:CBS domain containing-hemolysin-like protein
MDLLILYFMAAVVVSFICSVLESVLLSVNMPYISVLEKDRPGAGKLLRSHKEQINKSIASILILNTVANTVGAAAVGWVAEDGSKLGLALMFTVLPETILMFGFIAMFLL